MPTNNEQLNKQDISIFSVSTQIEEIRGLVDLHPSESHNQKVSKTSNPVENGASTTDNAVVEPRTLRLSGVVSDLRLEGTEVFSYLPGKELAKDAWARLKYLQVQCEPLTVVTMLETYENMLIVDLDAPVNEKTGHALEFTISLEEMLFADTELSKLSSSKVKGASDNEVRAREDGQKAPTSPAENKTDTVERGKILPKKASNQLVEDLKEILGEELTNVLLITLKNYASQRFTVPINGQEVTMTVSWSDVMDGWVADVALPGGKKIVVGRRINHGVPIIKQFGTRLVPEFQGDFIAHPKNPHLSKLGRLAWGATHDFVYTGSESTVKDFIKDAVDVGIDYVKDEVAKA